MEKDINSGWNYLLGKVTTTCISNSVAYFLLEVQFKRLDYLLNSGWEYSFELKFILSSLVLEKVTWAG